MNTAAWILYAVFTAGFGYGFWRATRHLNQAAAEDAALIKRALQAELDAIIEDYHCARWDAEVNGR